MPDNSMDREPLLARECLVFTRYLASQSPSDYVQAAYVRCHARIPCRDAGTVDAVDRLFLRAARIGPLPARIADAYARFARPGGALRQKLILLLAILENSPQAHERFNTAAVGAPLRAGAGVLLAGCAGVASLAAGILLLGPLHLIARVAGSGRGTAP